MDTVTIIDDKYATLIYHCDKGFVQHHFHKALDSQHMRVVLNRGIELLKQYGVTKWLSDNREISPLSEDDSRWADEDWLPRAVAAGWKYWALVVPHDVYARIYMAEFVNSFYEKGIRIMVFTDLQSAEKWLVNVDR